jgi:hypothetical protein
MRERTPIKFFPRRAENQENKGAPGAPVHNDRPEEQRADKFRDQFVKEQKAYQKAQKEQQRQKNRERKRKKDDQQ